MAEDIQGSSARERQQDLGRVAEKSKGGQRGKAEKAGLLGKTWEGSRDNWQNKANDIR